MPTDHPLKLLRIIDANINRAAEGLRLLEDIARLYLDDASLSQPLKELRHKLAQPPSVVQQQLVRARDAASDVGGAQAVETDERASLHAVVMANARRVQESLRTLEEMARLAELKPLLGWVDFKQARFALYDLEQRLLARLSRHQRLEHLRGLYVIIDDQALAGREVEVTRQAIKGGAKVIQLRDKQRSKRELLSLAQELAQLCAQSGALFIVNDHLDIALAINADGLHLGQNDLPLPIARRLLPPDMILGWSTHSLGEARLAAEQGADYIAVGTIYPSPTKPGARAVGPELVKQVKQVVSLPLVAIGGINENNVAQVIEAGAQAAAVISAVASAGDPESAARRLCQQIEAAGQRPGDSASA
jgi:thiamine-phosphate pyrophosphorylase